MRRLIWHRTSWRRFRSSPCPALLAAFLVLGFLVVKVLVSASLQSESQTPTRGQTNATRKQAKGGRRKGRKEERQREGAREKRKGNTLLVRLIRQS